jgi:hypothetical protein
VNDLPQDDKTTFTGNPIPWGKTNNGNGAVAFKGAAADLYLGGGQVAAPVEEKEPVTFFSTSQYSGEVVWYPADSTFKGGQLYTATITLTPKVGYAFPSPENITAYYTQPQASSVVVTHEYDLQAYVPVPVEGVPAPTNVETSNMYILIDWRVYDDSKWEPHNGLFEKEKIYGAVITLKLKTGTFDPNITFQYPNNWSGTGGPIKGYYQYNGAADNWTLQTGELSDKLKTTYDGANLTKEEATKTRFVMVGFDETQNAAPLNPGRAPGDPVGGNPLAVITFKRLGISEKVIINGPFTDAQEMLQKAKDAGNTKMSITLSKIHDDTYLPENPDKILANYITSDKSPSTVFIDGGGRLLNTTEDGPTITVENGVTLTLYNIILEHESSADYPVIKVEDGGHLILGDGVSISGNNAANGGGVYVASGGTFEMYGGTISGNTATTLGGGVYMASGGTFTMKGGTVSGNTANTLGGGVYVAKGGTFKKMYCFC